MNDYRGFQLQLLGVAIGILAAGMGIGLAATADYALYIAGGTVIIAVLMIGSGGLISLAYMAGKKSIEKGEEDDDKAND